MSGKKREPRGGYTGKLLRVDLTKGSAIAQRLDPDLISNYIGGAGIAGKILYDEIPPAVQPLDPQNIVVVMTGPLTGTHIPGSANFSVVTKSPLDNGAIVTNANGAFGRSLKFTGFDGLVITGKADHPVYLSIDDDKVEIHDASNLAGLDTHDTCDALQEVHGASSSVGCIGPAGENQVRFAGILFDKDHSASKGGAGAVLGSKNLKAIVVKASRGEISIDDRDAMARVLKRWRDVDDKHGLGIMVSQRGMRGLYEKSYDFWANIPIKNLTQCELPDPTIYNYEKVSNPFTINKASCPTCNFNHFNRLVYDGEDLKEPSFDTLVGYGPNLGITDPVEMVKLLTLVDRLGMETQETSWLLSFLMECVEERIVTRADLDGLDLGWGNYEAACQLVVKTARREGCGHHLAEGVYRTAERLGEEGLRRAIYVNKARVPQSMDNRNDWTFVFSEIVGNVGHYEAAPNSKDMFFGHELSASVPHGPAAATDAYALPKHQAIGGPLTQFIDMLGVCFLHGAVGDVGLLVEALNAATGLGIDAGEALLVGKRFINLMRVFAIRNGRTIEHDSISPRYLTPPTRGHNAGRSLGTYLPEILGQYYALMGWDDKGVPLSETLRDLGLQSVAEDLRNSQPG